MGEGIKAFWLGFFIVVTVAVTAWLVTFLNPSVGDCGHKLKVRFSDIQDISIGTRVTFGGRPVGRVTKITMIPDARNLPPDAEGTYYVYQLELCVDSSVHVYTYDEIMFSVAGLMGEKSISILPRVTPAGAPAAKEITNTVLYGTSKDSVQQALAELTNVARDMEHTLHTLDAFLDKNLEPFHQATVALSKAADSLDGLVHQINDTHLITRINSAADSVTSLANRISDSQIIPSLSCTLDRIACGQGTLGRLVNSDAAYLQLTSVLCSLDTLVSDLKNYGIFSNSHINGVVSVAVNNKNSLICALLKTPLTILTNSYAAFKIQWLN